MIAALQDAVEKGKGKDDDKEKDGALATVEDYQKTAGKLKVALGEEESGTSANVAYESATISTTTIEAEIGGETVSAQFVSFERVSYDSETGCPSAPQTPLPSKATSTTAPSATRALPSASFMQAPATRFEPPRPVA